MRSEARSTRKRVLWWLAVVATTCSAASAAEFPQIPDSEVSDAAFARASVPLLLGRPARGVEEVRLIAAVSEAFGRDAAARMLMQEPEFVDYWSSLILDILRVNRFGYRVAQDLACIGDPVREGHDGGVLAAFIRDEPPHTDVAVPPFNLTDVIRSALELDDLSVVYQAYLFPLAARHVPSNDAFVAETFLRNYLNREIGCLGCHNRTYSISNKADAAGNVVWRRLWSIPVNIEKALFGNYFDAVATMDRLNLVFRRDASGPEGYVPWQIDIRCTNQLVAGSGGNQGYFTHPPDPRFESIELTALDGSGDDRITVAHLERAFRRGVDQLSLSPLSITTPPPPPVYTTDQRLFCDFTQLMQDSCAGCHLGYPNAGPLNLGESPATAVVDEGVVVPGDRAASSLYSMVESGTMPWNAPDLPAADVEVVGAWIDAGAPDDDPELCVSSHVPDVPFEQALAFQVAVNAVDRIWTTVAGAPLTIDHGFPRNEAQHQALWYLTEEVFLPGQWSLRDLLVEILTSDAFLRLAPAEGGAGTYALPMLWDPWVEADPTTPPPVDPLGARAHNGPGELTNRRPVLALDRQVAAALDWRLNPVLYRPMGRYESPEHTGFAQLDFQSLLFWDSEFGNCSDAGRTDERDWIDRLVMAAPEFDSANGASPLTFRDAYLTLKDWLLQDPTLQGEDAGMSGGAGSATEEQALQRLLQAGLPSGVDISLDSPALSLGQDFLAAKLRETCGALIKTPDFMLTQGIPASYAGGLPASPRFRLCNAGACDAAEMCEVFRKHLDLTGHTAYCIDGAISAQPPPAATPGPLEIARDRRRTALERLCPSGLCVFIPWKKVDACARLPSLCREPPAPPCDPACTGPRCCGALPADVATPGLLSSRVAGAVVRSVSGVTVARSGSERFVALAPGDRLRPGDVLQIPVTAELLATLGSRGFGIAGDPEPPRPAIRPGRLPSGRPSSSDPQPIARPTDRLTKRPPDPSRDRWTKFPDPRRTVLEALERPIFLSVEGSERRLETRGQEAGRIERAMLSADATREAFQSRVPGADRLRRLRERASRLPPNRTVAEPFDYAETHAPEPAAPAHPAEHAGIDVELTFAQRGDQALFCPGAKPIPCTGSCRFSLARPQRCGVVGVVNGNEAIGAVTFEKSGTSACRWLGNSLRCARAHGRQRR